MKIKTKLRLGFGFLFLVLVFFGGIALYYINEISLSARVILKDNYATLHYTREMRSILDERPAALSITDQAQFDRQLRLEEQNITETGEKEAVNVLRTTFKQLTIQGTGTNTGMIRVMRRQLRLIEEINMRAIVRKSDAAQRSVHRATLYLGFAASISFLVLFSFIVNFPGFVANPLREFSEGIRAIIARNYSQRLEVKGTNEFSELALAFNEMAGRLNDWENSSLAEIRSEKLRIEAIIGQMQDAIIGLNEQQQILFINEVAARLLHLEEEQVIGLDARDLARKNDLLENILHSGNSEKPVKIYADGKESYFQVESREIIVSDFSRQAEKGWVTSGKPAGNVYILRNITPFKELDEAKTNFIATVSHELKTPISSIKLSLKLLEDGRIGTMNNEQSALVKNISEDTGRLLKITSELLDLSAVETGNIQLNLVAAAPGQVIDYAMEAVKFQADQKQIKLELITRESLPKIFADVEKTAWVLINFLSNALRYGPEKSKVVIQVVEKGKFVEFSVRDFGNGIDEKYTKQLFDRYFQVPTDGTNKSGSGLGLAISKEFIEAQSGQIRVESAIGEGSRFYFTLPVAG